MTLEVSCRVRIGRIPAPKIMKKDSVPVAGLSLFRLRW